MSGGRVAYFGDESESEYARVQPPKTSSKVHFDTVTYKVLCYNITNREFMKQRFGNYQKSNVLKTAPIK